jgi:hypothetical protein
MNKAKPSNRSLVVVALVWQLVVYVLAVGGIFVEVFDLLGIPWNSRGLENVIGTAVGFVLLELPLVLFLVYVFRRRSRKDPL